MQPSASRAGAPPSSTGERKAQVSWQSQARGLTRHPGLLTTQGGPFPPPGFSPISPQPEDVSNTGEVPCARTDASCPCPFWAGPSVGVSTQGQGGGQCGSWAAPGRVSWVREGAFPRGYCLLLCELGKMVPAAGTERRKSPARNSAYVGSRSCPLSFTDLSEPQFPHLLITEDPQPPPVQRVAGTVLSTEATVQVLLPPFPPPAPPPGAQGTKPSLCSPRGRSWLPPTSGGLSGASLVVAGIYTSI